MRLSDTAFRALFERSLDGISLADDEGRIVDVNPAGCRLFGVERERLIGRLISDFAEVGQVSDAEEHWRSFRREGEMRGLFRLRQPSGTVLVLEYAATAGFAPGLNLSILRDITEQIEARRKLHEEEERLTIALEAASMGTWKMVFGERGVWCDERFRRLHGIDPAMVDPIAIDDEVVRGLHPEDVARVFAEYDEIARGPGAFHIEYRVVWPDGSVHWLSSQGRALRNARDGRLYVTGVCSDCSEAKSAERALRESEARFRQLTEAIDQVFWMLDPLDRRILYTSPAYERLWGRTREHPLEALEDFLSPILADDLPRAQAYFERQLHGPAECEYRIVRPDGTIRWIRDRAFPIRDATGDVYRVTGLAEDVTTVKEAREALLQSEARHRRLVDSNIIGIVVSDLEGGIFEANDAFLRLLGYTREDFAAGKIRWDTCTAPEFRALNARQVRALIADGATAPYEKEYVRKDGSRVPVLIGLALIEPRDRALGFVIDLSERKRIERELTEALRARDEFLSVASHELRTPLTALKLQAQLRLRNLAEGKPDLLNPERLEAVFTSQERQIDRLTRLIDDMLDVSRINTGRLSVERERFDLCELVAEQVQQHAIEAALARCPVSIVASGPLPVCLDRFRIAQVLTNLLSNALKYGAGGPVRVEVARCGDAVELRVRDEGRGIAPCDHARIFQRFERAVAEAEVSGLGLGLYIVRQIVDLHEGTIQVESELGRGASFIVRLPLGDAGPLFRSMREVRAT